MSQPSPPKEHQRVGVEWVRKVRRGLLGDEPGLGKSRIAIDATQGAERVLVVAPSLVLSSGNWNDEIDRWATDRSVYTQAPYSMLNDRVRTGKGSGTKPVHRLRPEYKGHWDALIVDESHYIKGRDTSWTWAIQQIGRNADIVLPMTGTPIPNWSHELFTTLQLIYPEEASRGQRYGSFWRWAEQWFDTSPTRFSNGNPVVGEMLACRPECLRRPADDPCDHYVRFTQANLGERFLRRLRRDCLDLPPLTEQDVLIELSTADRAIYRKLRKDFAATVDGQEVLAWSQGAKNNLLDLLTVSSWLLNPQGEPKGGKFEMLRYDLASRSRPTFVVAHHRAVVEAAARVASSVGARAAYAHGGDKPAAARAVRDFKAGKLDVLVGSIEMVAEGLTLTQADMVIFLEKSFKPSRNEQAKFRIHRLGQEHPCHLRDYITVNTVDERKRRLLATKTDRQMRVLTAAQFLELL